jgi:CRISPR-associated protein Cas6
VKIEAQFPVYGDQTDADHLYYLYSSLSHAVPAFHKDGMDLHFGPINGEKGSKGRIRLHQHSRLRVRLPAEEIAAILPLAGRTLDLGGHVVRLGVPTVAPLDPVPALAARVVTFKHAVQPERFLEMVRRRLDEMDIRGEPGIFLIRVGPRAGQPRRVVVRIKGQRVVGYSLLVEGLTAEESIRLQEGKLGGRTRLGCGFFIPYAPRLS